MEVETTLFLLGVSSGDATLVRHVDGDRIYHVLIDGGLNCYVVRDFLLNHDIKRLDLVIASHLDYDHLGGLLAIFEEEKQISISEFWTFDIGILKAFLETGEIPRKEMEDPRFVMRFLPAHDLQKMCEIRGIPCRQVMAGHVARYGGLLLEVLYPTEEYLNFLYNPITLKQILQKARIPLEWKVGQHPDAPKETTVEGKRKPHRRVRFPKEAPAVAKWEESVRNRFMNWTDEDEAAQEIMTSYWQLEERHEPEHPNIHERDEDGRPSEVCTPDTIFNDMSSLIRLSSVGRSSLTSVLFTGDLENWTSLLITDGHRLRADVLKLPHHGSSGVGWSPSKAFEYSEYVMRYHYRRGSFDFGKQTYYPTCLCPRVFQPDIFSGDLGELLDLVKPTSTMVFPFRQFGLPEKSVMKKINKRSVKIVSNRVEDKSTSDLASIEPKTRTLRLVHS